MGVNSLPKTVTRQRRGCDLNPGRTAPEFSTLTTQLPSQPRSVLKQLIYLWLYTDTHIRIANNSSSSRTGGVTTGPIYRKIIVSLS